MMRAKPWSMSFIAACLLLISETTFAAAKIVAITPVSGGPVTIVGNGFQPIPNRKVTVILKDANNQTVAQQTVSPDAQHCNSKTGCFGGGDISIQFTVQQFGQARDSSCALLKASAKQQT